MGYSTSDVLLKLDAWQAQWGPRNEAKKLILAVREGRWGDVAPGILPEGVQAPIVANFIDVAARDVANIIAKMPSFNCSSGSMVSDRARKRADLRTKIAKNYVQSSRLGSQMNWSADAYCSYGHTAFVVEADYDKKMPFIRAEREQQSYYDLDRRGRVVCYARVFKKRGGELCNEFPEYANEIRHSVTAFEPNVEYDCVRWFDADGQKLIFKAGGIVLREAKNLIKRCPVVVVERPGLSHPRGQFDDVVYVQLARALTATYALEAMEKSVHAPTVVPDDVQDLEFGDNAVLRTRQGAQSVGRVQLPIPPGVFQELQNLNQELYVGSRYPEGRTGEMDASIITGRGVQALQAGFDSQIEEAQGLLAAAFEDVLAMCFELDEAVWPNLKKTIRGSDEGAPFSVDYMPSRDIDGDWTVDVHYGMAAGLDPNRALVFLLQANAAGAISKGTLRREMPMDINVTEEETLISVEETRGALGQAMAGYAQAIPMMATNGMDPSQAVLQIAKYLELVKKGKPVEVAVQEALAPEPPPQANPLEVALAGGGQGAGGGVFDAQTGLPPGIAQGQAGMGAGGAQDLLMSLAGTTPSGQPNLAATVSRRQPTA